MSASDRRFSNKCPYNIKARVRVRANVRVRVRVRIAVRVRVRVGLGLGLGTLGRQLVKTWRTTQGRMLFMWCGHLAETW